jgi:hypothetical protein
VSRCLDQSSNWFGKTRWWFGFNWQVGSLWFINLGKCRLSIGHDIYWDLCEHWNCKKLQSACNRTVVTKRKPWRLFKDFWIKLKWKWNQYNFLRFINWNHERKSWICNQNWRHGESRMRIGHEEIRISGRRARKGNEQL